MRLRFLIKLQFDNVPPEKELDYRVTISKGMTDLIQSIQPEYFHYKLTDVSDTVYLDPIEVEV